MVIYEQTIFDEIGIKSDFKQMAHYLKMAADLKDVDASMKYGRKRKKQRRSKQVFQICSRKR